VLQVVAGPVVAAVLLVETNVRAVVEATVGRAAGQVGNDLQEVRGHQVVVAKCCGREHIKSSVKKLQNCDTKFT